MTVPSTPTAPDASPAPAASGRRQAVLRLLKDAAGPITINDISAELGIHPNTVRFHLDALVRSGQVEQVEPERRTPGRPPQLFRVVPGMDPTGPRHYQLLAGLLVQSLASDPEPGERAVEAGRAWGRGQGATGGEGSTDGVDQLVGLLDELGFAPEPSVNGGHTQIGLRHCPFLELAQSGPQIVCLVHLGLMQGAMEAWASPLTVDRLESFVEPNLCVAHLASAGAA